MLKNYIITEQEAREDSKNLLDPKLEGIFNSILELDIVKSLGLTRYGSAGNKLQGSGFKFTKSGWPRGQHELRGQISFFLKPKGPWILEPGTGGTEQNKRSLKSPIIFADNKKLTLLQTQARKMQSWFNQAENKELTKQIINFLEEADFANTSSGLLSDFEIKVSKIDFEGPFRRKKKEKVYLLKLKLNFIKTLCKPDQPCLH